VGAFVEGTILTTSFNCPSDLLASRPTESTLLLRAGGEAGNVGHDATVVDNGDFDRKHEMAVLFAVGANVNFRDGRSTRANDYVRPVRLVRFSVKST
jgi:hypothetical protein